MPISRLDSPPSCIGLSKVDSLRRIKICVTIGDPCGIGPEVVTKALKNPALKDKADFLIIGAPAVKEKDQKACARDSIEFINTAFKIVIKKKADALVTGPVSKEEINRAGIRFDGHTEYLAKLCGCAKFAMMFVSDTLKVSLVTRHIALSSVHRSISVKAVCDTVELTCGALRHWFGIKLPKVGVSGLNPHCGEGGFFGKEERFIIKPAIKKLQNTFGGILGPIPADTLLYETYNKRFDAAVCMYHDQGLAAFKMISRDRGVNITLGLPFIRTSPDHGTGFDIAGKGIADPGSMLEAIKLAVKLVKMQGCLHR